ncbi:MAG TPA: YafY family protein [Candidatus Dormibacteraeota bacterium]|nr:YafY family protein [Candidatus Dormibacteraeota bacterium]
MSLVLLLQARGRSTAAELAERLEVSVRTVYRDLDALSAAGVPVYAERGRHGGCQLVDGYQTRLTGLSGPEAEVLFLSSVSGPVAELGRGPALAQAQLKLLSALPDALRARASSASQRLHVDLHDWFQPGEPTPYLSQLAKAVWEERGIAIRYQRTAGELVRRQLQPLGLVAKAGTWYLAAQPEGGAPRVYRLSRVTELQISTQTFQRPPNFVLAEFWRGQALEFERSRPEYRVTVRATEAGYRAIRARLTASLREERKVGRRHQLVLDLERVEYAQPQLLGLGPEVEVLSPIELRRRMAKTSLATANLYPGP